MNGQRPLRHLGDSVRSRFDMAYRQRAKSSGDSLFSRFSLLRFPFNARVRGMDRRLIRADRLRFRQCVFHRFARDVRLASYAFFKTSERSRIQRFRLGGGVLGRNRMNRRNHRIPTSFLKFPCLGFPFRGIAFLKLQFHEHCQNERVSRPFRTRSHRLSKSWKSSKNRTFGIRTHKPMHNGNHAFFQHIRHEGAGFFGFGNLRMRIVRSISLSSIDDILIQIRLPRMSREFDIGNGRRMGFRDVGSRFQFRKFVNRLLVVLGVNRLGKPPITYALAVRSRGHW